MSDSEYVNLENAKALAELGYEGEFPQMVWADDYLSYRDSEPYISPDGCPACGQHSYCSCIGSIPVTMWYPAPTHLRALEWLTAQESISIQVTLFEEYASYGYERLEDGHLYMFHIPDELIAEICRGLVK